MFLSEIFCYLGCTLYQYLGFLISLVMTHTLLAVRQVRSVRFLGTSGRCWFGAFVLEPEAQRLRKGTPARRLPVSFGLLDWPYYIFIGINFGSKRPKKKTNCAPTAVQWKNWPQKPSDYAIDPFCPLFRNLKSVETKNQYNGYFCNRYRSAPSQKHKKGFLNTSKLRNRLQK